MTRPPTREESNFIGALLSVVQSEDQAAYREQASGMQVRDDTSYPGQLYLMPAPICTEAPNRREGVIAEAEYFDRDDVPVRQLLFARSGRLYFLEHMKPDNLPVIDVLPHVDRIRIVVD